MSISYEVAVEKSDRKGTSLLISQQTLGQSVSAEGLALFTGERVSICLCPAEEDHGIVFQRVDLPHRPRIPAKLQYVQGTARCTMLGNKKESVQTIEHLLAALKAAGIDNALVEISGSEVPVFDGSALFFVEMIEKAGIKSQEKEKSVHVLKTPIFWSCGETHLIALPSDELRFSYTLHYPHYPAIGTQFYSFAMTSESFKREIAPCRTFSIYEEIAPMIERGLMKGGSLENAVLFKDGTVLNSEGLRFPEEPVRHKILDLIGDLSLFDSISAHIVAIRSGHASNVAFGRELYNHMKMECL